MIKVEEGKTTHPDYATLVDPLYATRKEGKGKERKKQLHPLSAEGEERVAHEVPRGELSARV